MDFEPKQFIYESILEKLPVIESDSEFFPDEKLKSNKRVYEFEHKKNISAFVLNKANFTENQTKKTFEIINFLQKKYSRNGALLIRKKELNCVTKNPEPIINHCLTVADRLIQIIWDGSASMTKEDIYHQTKKWRDISTVNSELYAGYISALLHDVVEDDLTTIEEVESLLKNDIEMSNQHTKRVLAIIDFLTRKNEETIDEYMNRIEDAKSQNNIAARLAQIIKVGDIEVNGESEHSLSQTIKYEERYIFYLFNRFRWINDLFPEWMNNKIIENNPYIKEVVDMVKQKVSKETDEYLNKIRK